MADVVAAAEAYFQDKDIRLLLTGLLVQLGRERPCDPREAIRGYLAADKDADASLIEGDLLQLLAREKLGKQPYGDDLSQRLAWGGGFNRGVLESWVPQPSPCCGCASVAGAFNALYRLGRSATACTIHEVAELMAQQLEKGLGQRQRRLERLLGVREGALEAFYQKLDEELESKGLGWSGKGEQAISKAVALKAAGDLLAKHRAVEAAPVEEPGGHWPRDIFDALHDVLVVVEDQADQEPEAKVEQVARAEPDWRAELWQLLSKRRGIFRLRAKLPSTTDVGSGGLRDAAEALALARGVEEKLKVVFVMARKGVTCSAPLAGNDSEAAIHQQWSCLKRFFSAPSTVLLFHLTNHYALVFAWREWQDEEPMRLRRQILTARKGQRPSAWIDFEEVRKILLAWSGYHLLALRRVPADPLLEPQ